MEVSDESSTLLVRHLPSALTVKEREELLKHFGASSVQCMPDKGKLRYAAFARFPDVQTATDVLKRLHQLEVLGSTLVVEFSKQSQHKKHHPPHLKEPGILSEKAKEESSQVEGQDIGKTAAENVNALSSRLGLTYPINPKLHYAYPLPDVTTLTNIANALASVPRFYVQVLHLMNKMNLPPPFGAVTPSPPLPEGKIPSLSRETKKDQATNTHEHDFLEMDSDESEIMSDEEGPRYPSENAPVKRQGRQPAKKRKKPRLEQLIQAPVITPKSTPAPAPEEVFEVATSNVNLSSKAIEFKLVADKAEEFQPKMKTKESTQPPLPPGPPPEEVGEFGRLEPVARMITDDQDDQEEEEFGEGEFISSSQLRKGRLGSSQMKDFSVFKNYSSGEPSSRLYIKNLAKQTTEKDLHFVYGRYVDWSNEQEKLMFDIRLMKEGRMKGQAFVTLPGEKVAKKALKDTHAYVLNTKPMVVQFARSAKPKDNQPKS